MHWEVGRAGVHLLISADQKVSVVVRVELANFLCRYAVELQRDVLRLRLGRLDFDLHSDLQHFTIHHV